MVQFLLLRFRWTIKYMSIENLKKIKVLLVEDEYNLAILLKNAIGDNFANFMLASNGRDGIKKFKQYMPNLVITDIMMPDLTGLEMAKELKKINSDVKIIILSAYSDIDKLLDAIDIGVIKYFIKPFDLDEVLDYIIYISDKLKSNKIELVDNFCFNIITQELFKNNNKINLSNRETKFINLLLQNNIVSTDCIKKELWNNINISNERVRTFIKRLRIKTSKTMIKNIKSEGYQIVF